MLTSAMPMPKSDRCVHRERGAGFFVFGPSRQEGGTARRPGWLKTVAWLGFLFLFTVGGRVASGQTSEQELLRRVRQLGMRETRDRIVAALTETPGNVALQYFDTVLQPDGEIARQRYESLVQRAPDSPFGRLARLRLAKYLFAVGMYVTARDHFLVCADELKDRELAAQAAYLAARSLYASGQPEAAAEEMRSVIQRFSGSTAANLAAADLAEWTPGSSLKVESGVGPYTLQVGAFIDPRNAESLRSYLSSRGLKVEVQEKERGGRLFHLIWVGRFQTAETAQKFGEEFRRLFKRAYQVVDVREP